MAYLRRKVREKDAISKTKENNQIIRDAENLWREMRGILRCRVYPEQSEQVLQEMKRLAEPLRRFEV